MIYFGICSLCDLIGTFIRMGFVIHCPILWSAYLNPNGASVGVVELWWSLNLYLLIFQFSIFVWSGCQTGRWVRRKCAHGCQHRCFCFTPDPTETFQLGGDADDKESSKLLEARDFDFKTRTTDTKIGMGDSVTVSVASLVGAKWKRRLMFAYFLYLVPFVVGGKFDSRPSWLPNWVRPDSTESFLFVQWRWCWINTISIFTTMAFDLWWWLNHFSIILYLQSFPMMGRIIYQIERQRL